ncbi:hypothetical protein IKE71_02700 [Candidatus Saccharibacteria bacterium]|nr:hypothetical protein [Candidatus Saccharibacteria bacterium]
MQPIKEINLITQALRASLTMLGLFVLAFCLVPTLISEASAAEDISVTATRKSIYLILDPDFAATEAGEPISDTGHGDIDFGEIVPTKLDTLTGNIGTMIVKKRTINVDTNGNYYAVYLSSGSSNNNLNLTYNSTSNSNIYIPASSGTWASPAPFTGAGWGYAVPGTPVPIDPAATTPTYPNFSASSVFSPTLLDTPLIYNNGGNVYTANFAGVPEGSSAQQIWKAGTSNLYGFSSGNNGIATGDTVNSKFDIYYAVVVNDHTVSGAYTNQIVYTAISSSSSLDEVSTNLYRNIRIGQGGETVDLEFEIAGAVTTAIQENQLTVRLVLHSDMVTANYDPTALTSAQLANIKNCPIKANSFSISETGTTAGLGKVSCTIPAGTNGTGFDFWLNIGTYNYDYVSKYNANDEHSASSSDTLVSSFIYANSLQTPHPDLANENAVKYMQEMTGSICQNTNIWSNQIGDSARILDPSGTTPLLAAGEDTLGVSSFTLTDVRDNKTYKIRRLADGNCWMVQNLDLDLASVGTLTSKDTDLTAKTSWTVNANIDAASSSLSDGTMPWQLKSTVSEGGYHYSILAATANSGVLGSLKNAPDSICAAGWRLPANGAEFETLVSVYGLPDSPEGSSLSRSLPISVIMTGDGFYHNVYYGAGSYTSYWSSLNTTNIDFGRYCFNLSVEPEWLTENGDGETYGFMVRCVAR